VHHSVYGSEIHPQHKEPSWPTRQIATVRSTDSHQARGHVSGTDSSPTLFGSSASALGLGHRPSTTRRPEPTSGPRTEVADGEKGVVHSFWLTPTMLVHCSSSPRCFVCYDCCCLAPKLSLPNTTTHLNIRNIKKHILSVDTVATLMSSKERNKNLKYNSEMYQALLIMAKDWVCSLGG